MAEIIIWLELVISKIPLPILEVWGRFAFLLGSMVAIFAFTGFTFRNGKQFRISREVWTWNLKSFYFFLITFVSIFISGYLGSSIVLIPGAQTLESLKDLSVFLCLNFFGYPALLAVPFAYGLSDLIEGVPPDFLWDWLPGYFINPSLFWISYQMIGKSPNFSKPRVWVYYLIFVFLFLILEPFLWGFLCSKQFGPEISYHTISSALIFTTGITWILAPLVTFLLFPFAKRIGYFWADIPFQVKEVSITEPRLVWNSAFKNIDPKDPMSEDRTGISLQLFIVAPFVCLVLILVGITSYVTLKNAEQSAYQMVEILHKQWSKNIRLQLFDLETNVENINSDPSILGQVLDASIVNTQGRVFLFDHNLSLISSLSNEPKSSRLLETLRVELRKQSSDMQFLETRLSFSVVTKKPLSRENWNAYVSRYDVSKTKETIYLVTLFPYSFYLNGVYTGNSESAMVFAWAILLSLVLAVLLAELVTRPILRFSSASKSLAKGDWDFPVGESMIAELRGLSDAFRFMSQELKSSFERVSESQRMVMETNTNLEKIVNDRTVALMESNRNLLDTIETKERILLDLHNTQNQLLLSEKLAALGQFAAGITHELNTPLGAIASSVRAMSEILKKDIANLPNFLVTLNKDQLDDFQALLMLSLSFGDRSSGLMSRAEKKERLAMLRDKNVEYPDEVLDHLTSIGVTHLDSKIFGILQKPGVHLILQNVVTLGSLYRLVYVVQSATEKASHVVNALKHYLYTDQSVSDSNSQKVNIPTELDSILTLYQAKIKKDVEIIKNYFTSDSCLADRDKLNQVWINLINNALQAMDYKGKIKISVTTESEFILTSIKDSGKGIDPEIQDKVFLPFFTTKKHGEGIGLGLDICKQIVEKMNGKIDFISGPSGTEFRVYIPKV
ncbi:HAMP domain-containing protein [Leptospira bouyouniensis]|uniref:histidine kinase n=1 Tax=Leptospira bouyouniensis TaxID=2484911 RepID=A0A7I0HNR1_9LEPT|nr:ATP-binding protein [Leptospira bouyouniensis]TGL03331.1 HAMP domain-containing protein [Leptospira bouyouniensis]